MVEPSLVENSESKRTKTDNPNKQKTKSPKGTSKKEQNNQTIGKWSTKENDKKVTTNGNTTL